MAILVIKHMQKTDPHISIILAQMVLASQLVAHNSAKTSANIRIRQSDTIPLDYPLFNPAESHRSKQNYA